MSAARVIGMAVGGKGKGQLVKTAIKYGVRYGPVAFEAFKHGREPAQQAVQSVLARRNARKIAVEHAARALMRAFERARGGGQ